MTDIVQRLRASLSYDTPARYPDMVTEAADEIVRLRADRADMADMVVWLLERIERQERRRAELGRYSSTRIIALAPVIVAAAVWTAFAYPTWPMIALAAGLTMAEITIVDSQMIIRRLVKPPSA